MEKPFALIVEDDRRSAALFRHVVDLVLLDLNPPGVSGNRILEFIRKAHRLQHGKVVVISGQAHVASGLSAQTGQRVIRANKVPWLPGSVLKTVCKVFQCSFQANPRHVIEVQALILRKYSETNGHAV